MQDGDKVLAVGGVPVPTWDALRAQVKGHDEPVSITLERAGKRLELSVTPRSGVIGVSPLYVKRPIGLVESARLAFALPLRIVSATFQSVVATHERHVFKGPVGIVQETGKAGEQGGLDLLHFLAILGSYFWPIVAALHLFDEATGWAFRLTFSEPHLPDAVRRIARLRFSMHFALACYPAFLLGQWGVDSVPGSLVVVMLLVPGVSALWPLMWISARELWGKRALFGVLLPVTLVPCVAPIIGVWLALRLNDEEQRLRSHQSAH